MKTSKRPSALFLLLTLVFTLTACNNNHNHEDSLGSKINYHPLLVQYSDSIPGTNHKAEISSWQKEPYIDEAAKQTVEKYIDGTWISGKYKHTDRDFPNNFDTRIYYDDRNLQFGLDDEGKLQFYFWGDDSDGEKVYTETECLDIAKKFVTPYQDISGYRLETVRKENRGLYEFTFTKHAGDYPTMDQAIVTVHESGKLYSYSSFMFGKIPDKVAEFDKDRVLKAVTEKLDALYADVKKQEGVTIVYEQPELMYMSADTLYCVVDVEHKTSTGDVVSVISERIGLLIEL